MGLVVELVISMNFVNAASKFQVRCGLKRGLVLDGTSASSLRTVDQKPLYSLQSQFHTCNRRSVRPYIELDDAVLFRLVGSESHRYSIYYVLAAFGHYYRQE